MQLKTYRLKVETPTSSHWVTKKAISENTAKHMAVGLADSKYGWWVSECVEVTKKEEA